MKRTIKISISDPINSELEELKSLFKEGQSSYIEEDVYLENKDYLQSKSVQEFFYFNVSQDLYNIYNFIHIIDLSDRIKTLSKIEKFLLTIYVVNTYGNSESKETDELIINLTELEFEIDSILNKEDGKEIDPVLDQILKIGNEYIDFKDIYLTLNDGVIPELSKEEAIVRLRDDKLSELFQK
jgi:hypothetical protein